MFWRFWPRFAYRFIHNEERREDFLGSFAPFQLIWTLVIWVGVLIIGWGLFFYGIRTQLKPPTESFAACVYYAGAAMFTVGYGDIVATTTFARIMSLVAASCGLGVVAVVTSFLFAVFGNFQARETFVVTIGARAGVPPSGIGLLGVHAHTGMRESLAQLFREGQVWTAHLMESHLAYPILVMFRSSHDYESWVGTLGALMDAAALVMSTIEPEDLRNNETLGQARIMYELGRHLTVDFAHYFKLMQTTTGSGAGVERREYDEACAQLETAGYRLRPRDESWQEFWILRSRYAAPLNSLALWLDIPPVQWVGDRAVIERQTAHIG